MTSRTERRRSVPWLAAMGTALGLVALPSAVQAQGERVSGKVLLRHHPSAGLRYSQVQEEEVHMRADSGSAIDLPEQRFRNAIYSVREVTGLAGGNASVTVRIDSAFAEVVLPTGEVRREQMMQLHGMVGGLVYDDRLRLVRVAFVDSAGAESDVTKSLAENVKSFDVCAFPVRAVAVGDSWEETLPVPVELPGLNRQLTAKVRMTLLDLRLAGGDTTAVIGIGFRPPDEPIAVTQAEGRFTMKVRGEWTGELRYSLTRGTALQLEFGGSMRVEVAGAARDAPSYAMRMDQRFAHRLLASNGGP